MIAKQITYNNLPKAIKIAFSGDTNLKDLYDPTATVETVDDMVADVERKVLEYSQQMPVTFMGVYEKNELVGYFVYSGMLLISFGLNIKCRIRNLLREFYQLIKKNVHQHFACILWTKNKRAIKWLLKNKMTILASNEATTQLINL